MVYFLHRFKQSGLLGDCHLHGIDSTELSNYCKMPLGSLKIHGKRIRIYNDIDCDCGARRNKRDNSPFLVNLAQAMGIELKLVTADEAYHDKDGSLFAQTGTIVTTPPSSKVLTPGNFQQIPYETEQVRLAHAIRAFPIVNSSKCFVNTYYYDCFCRSFYHKYSKYLPK